MMRFTKVIGFLSIFGFAAFFPLTAQAEQVGTAGAGEWDKLGTYTYTYSSPTVYSSGGDFRVCLSGSTPFLSRCTYMRMMPVTILMIM